MGKTLGASAGVFIVALAILVAVLIAPGRNEGSKAVPGVVASFGLPTRSVAGVPAVVLQSDIGERLQPASIKLQ